MRVKGFDQQATWHYYALLGSGFRRNDEVTQRSLRRSNSITHSSLDRAAVHPGGGTARPRDISLKASNPITTTAIVRTLPLRFSAMLSTPPKTPNFERTTDTEMVLSNVRPRLINQALRRDGLEVIENRGGSCKFQYDNRLYLSSRRVERSRGVAHPRRPEHRIVYCWNRPLEVPPQ